MDCFARRWKKLKATNDSSTSFTLKIPTITKPSGDNLIQLGRTEGGGLVPPWLELFFVLAGADNDTMDVRFTGWTSVGDLSPPTPIGLWIPAFLGQITCTGSTTVGIAAKEFVNTDRFVDTIIRHATITGLMVSPDTDTIGAGSTGENLFIRSAANETVATVALLTEGFEMIEVNFDATGTTTAANAGWRLVDRIR